MFRSSVRGCDQSVAQVRLLVARPGGGGQREGSLDPGGSSHPVHCTSLGESHRNLAYVACGNNTLLRVLCCWVVTPVLVLGAQLRSLTCVPGPEKSHRAAFPGCLSSACGKGVSSGSSPDHLLGG